MCVTYVTQTTPQCRVRVDYMSLWDRYRVPIFFRSTIMSEKRLETLMYHLSYNLNQLMLIHILKKDVWSNIGMVGFLIFFFINFTVLNLNFKHNVFKNGFEKFYFECTAWIMSQMHISYTLDVVSLNCIKPNRTNGKLLS